MAAGAPDHDEIAGPEIADPRRIEGNHRSLYVLYVFS
jgi:hypothetical protein